MGMRQVEAAILRELQDLTGDRKIRQKDIMEWSTGPIEAQEGETLYKLPGMGVNVAVKLPQKKAKSES